VISFGISATASSRRLATAFTLHEGLAFSVTLDALTITWLMYLYRMLIGEPSIRLSKWSVLRVACDEWNCAERRVKQLRISMRKVLFVSTLVTTVMVGLNAADATMPLLTPKPQNPSLAACGAWAAKQDDDAIEMWGIQEDGTSSRAIAIDRLARSCMGQRPPEIVGFGSSVGFNEAYCEKHSTIKLCKDYRHSR
jgi:hypothetical protein